MIRDLFTADYERAITPDTALLMRRADLLQQIASFGGNDDNPAEVCPAEFTHSIERDQGDSHAERAWLLARQPCGLSRAVNVLESLRFIDCRSIACSHTAKQLSVKLRIASGSTADSRPART